jgi:hypothetical protein
MQPPEPRPRVSVAAALAAAALASQPDGSVPRGHPRAGDLTASPAGSSGRSLRGWVMGMA